MIFPEDAIGFYEGLVGTVCGVIIFSMIWKSRTSSFHALVEENVFKTWNCGRIVCNGNSVIKVHKFLPIML
jgi:hypothetical protein